MHTHTGDKTCSGENNPDENMTYEKKSADINTVEKKTVEKNTLDSYNTSTTDLSSHQGTVDLEHGVSAIEYHYIIEERRLEIIQEGKRSMKDLAVASVTATCVVLYLVVFFALARFMIW
jgi:hypothetical protein